MKDALGGLFNLTLLFTFLFLITGFIIFGINYYKAFSVKNKIITTIEQYEGNMNNDKLNKKIDDYIHKLNYNPNITNRIKISNGDGWECNDNLGFCYYAEKFDEKKCSYIYKVRTFVDTDVPIFSRLFDSTNLFSVSGETKVIKKRSCK